MKPRKLLLTLVSVATIGLSSTVTLADGNGDQLRERLREYVKFEISPELQKMIDEFRAEREELMAQFRALHRAIAKLWASCGAI